MSLSILRHVFTTAALAVPLTAFAHDGHGNTPLHAVLHMLEQNGAVIGLMLVLGVGSLLWRAQQKRASQKRALQDRFPQNHLTERKEQDHDSR